METEPREGKISEKQQRINDKVELLIGLVREFFDKKDRTREIAKLMEETKGEVEKILAEIAKTYPEINEDAGAKRAIVIDAVQKKSGYKFTQKDFDDEELKVELEAIIRGIEAICYDFDNIIDVLEKIKNDILLRKTNPEQYATTARFLKMFMGLERNAKARRIFDENEIKSNSSIKISSIDDSGMVDVLSKNPKNLVRDELLRTITNLIQAMKKIIF